MTGWLVSNMIWATAVMLLILAIRRPFATLFGAGPVYALWLLPAFRLAAPPLPSWGVIELPTLIPPQTVILVAEDMTAPVPPAGGPGQWVPLLLAIWAAGAAAFLFWQFWTYHRFIRSLGGDARDLGNYRGVRLIESRAVDGPISLGLFRRRIVIPADFESRYSPEERALALDHEAVHHRRLDLWWNHLGLFILALNWFNPIAWFAFRAFRADQELACDAAVTARADTEVRHDYARALVKSASRPGLIAACPLNHADQLKRRLKMMKFHKPGRLRMLGGAAAIGTLGGLSLAFGSAAAQPAPPPAPPAPPSSSAPHDGDDMQVIVHTVREERGDGARTERRESRDGERREERRVTIITRDGDGDHAEHHGPGVVERFQLHRDPEGRPGAMVMDTPDCQDANRSEINEGTDDNRTRVIVCTRGRDGQRDPAQQARALQRARARLAEDNQIPAEQRERVLAAIDREIARLRGQ